MSATDCYLIVCRDAPDAVQKRTSLLNEHLEYCVRVESRYRVAGIVLTEDQASVAGSAMIVQARDSADALTMVTDDPYYPAGVWTHVDVMPYLIAFGNLVPPRMDRSLRVPGYEDHVESPSR